MSQEKRDRRIVIAVMLLLFAYGGYRFFSSFLIEEHGVIVSENTKGDLIFENPALFGKALFFDPRLSSDRSVSCASCHIPERAFTDGKSKSVGVGGRQSFRNAPTLLNVGNNASFMFDAHVPTLEAQAIVPIQDTNEMNMKMGDLVTRLKAIPHYAEAAEQLFHRELDAWVVTHSLAEFQKTLVSDNSTVDKMLKGEQVDGAVIEGYRVFKELQCIECHAPPHFTNYQALNNGLYRDYGNDLGRFRVTGDSLLIGSFKVPSLRNVALTAPYMHDGSIESLELVVDHYLEGGVNGTYQDKRIRKRTISESERNYLLTFLNALTDTSYLEDFRQSRTNAKSFQR